MWCLIGLIIFLILSFLLANHLYKQTNDYSNERLDIKDYLTGIPHNLQIVNLGSTYSKFAFGTYEDLMINGCNLAIQAQSLEMDRAIIKQYADHIAPDGVVVIVAAACLLLYREVGDNLLYYDILDKNSNPLYEWKGKIKSIFPLLFHPKKIKKLMIDTEKFHDVYDLYPSNLDPVKSETELNNMVECWKSLFSLMDLKGSDFSDDNYKIMQNNCEIITEIIDFCRERKFRPVVVVPPFSNRLNQYFSEEFKEKVIRQNITNIVLPRSVPFLNYQDDEEFQNAIELFADGGFRLNRRGSKIFFKRLATDLRQYGIEISNYTMRKTS